MFSGNRSWTSCDIFQHRLSGSYITKACISTGPLGKQTHHGTQRTPYTPRRRLRSTGQSDGRDTSSKAYDWSDTWRGWCRGWHSPLGNTKHCFNGEQVAQGSPTPRTRVRYRIAHVDPDDGSTSVIVTSEELSWVERLVVTRHLRECSKTLNHNKNKTT